MWMLHNWICQKKLFVGTSHMVWCVSLISEKKEIKALSNEWHKKCFLALNCDQIRYFTYLDSNLHCFYWPFYPIDTYLAWFGFDFIKCQKNYFWHQNWQTFPKLINFKFKPIHIIFIDQISFYFNITFKFIQLHKHMY